MNLQPEWFAGLIGVITPLVVKFIIGSSLERKWKSLIAILVSAVVGFASAILSGKFNANTILQSIAFCFSISQIFYDQVFKDLFAK